MSAEIQSFDRRRPRLLRTGLLAIAVMLPLAACDHPQELHGNLPDPQIIQQVVPGKTTKADVTRLLGSPSSISTFDTNKWYYVARLDERTTLSGEELLDQQVYVVQFDDSGVVKSIDHEHNNTEDVAMNERTTPAAGKELSLIEQLLGNFGKFNGDKQPNGNSGI